MSISQDPKSKTWFYRFTRNGNSHYKGGYRTAAFAKQSEASFLDKLVTEEIHPESRGQDVLFREGVEWYLTNISPHKKTSYIDRGRLGLAAKFFDNKKVSEIKPEDIENFLVKLPELRTKATPRLKTISEQTKNHYLASLRSLFNQLKKRGRYMGTNPALEVAFKKVPRARVRFLYPAEEKLLTPIVRQDSVLWPYYFLALHTGLRISELMAIRVKDIDLILGQLFIPNSKNSRSRYVPLSPNVEAYAKELVQGKDYEALLLPNWSYTHLRKHFIDCCCVAEVKNLHIHDMRHTFAQRLLSKGESIYIVSKLLGHSSVAVTQNHYGHLATSDLARTVSMIDGVVSCSVVAVRPLQSEVRGATNVS